jgi:hypothetical protein
VYLHGTVRDTKHQDVQVARQRHLTRSMWWPATALMRFAHGGVRAFGGTDLISIHDLEPPCAWA